MVKKSGWLAGRIVCVDFTDLTKQNSHKTANHYLEIRLESGVLMRIPPQVLLDATRGTPNPKWAKDDEEKTAFHTSQGVYCYTKMPFGLKNTGATYQRLVGSKARFKETEINYTRAMEEADPGVSIRRQKTAQNISSAPNSGDHRSTHQRVKGQITADFPHEKPKPIVLPQSEVKLQKPCIIFTGWIVMRIVITKLRAPIKAGVGRNLEEQIHLGDGDIYGSRRIRRTAQRFNSEMASLYRRPFPQPWLRSSGPNFIRLRAPRRFMRFMQYAHEDHDLISRSLRSRVLLAHQSPDARDMDKEIAMIDKCTDQVPRQPQNRIKHPITSPWPFHKWGIRHCWSSSLLQRRIEIPIVTIELLLY
ncbi:hypothetical protein Tco_1057812 [Tanacetum coccineum]|uniref:Uncharacterized protein n=1 Tax=Tanacetum coccineum TaxID=301880 RepID=A0ABQ5H759_9ASTR